MTQRRVIIMGAAGRDFHTFATLFRNDLSSRVVAFTAAQIPGIAQRRFPAELAGALYPIGIPIIAEEQLDDAIRRLKADEVVFAYSDVSFDYVMERATRAAAAGADFRLIAPERCMLTPHAPTLAIVAARTGCGKSAAARYVCRVARAHGLNPVVIRHPMPYGQLQLQQVQRFASLDDLRRADCTIEELEEYEPHVMAGTPVFAGVDYAAILEAAEREADVIVWDGGNNDTPFIRPNLTISIVDPHRAGDELDSYPGAINTRQADILLITKVDTAPAESIAIVRANIARVNRHARVFEAALPVTLDDAPAIEGRAVLVIEDGPTLTHGGMSFGAGTIAARQYGAASIVDPRPYAVGSLAEAFLSYPHISACLPALGYTTAQIHDLAETIRRTPCDVVVLGTPIDLRRLITFSQPVARAHYELEERGGSGLTDAITAMLERFQPQCA